MAFVDHAQQRGLREGVVRLGHGVTLGGLGRRGPWAVSRSPGRLIARGSPGERDGDGAPPGPGALAGAASVPADTIEEAVHPMTEFQVGAAALRGPRAAILLAGGPR
jgi:hypothetical protein